MTAFFVTATGTDIGKTFVTAGLIRHLRGRDREVRALKPIVSGFDDAHPGGSDPAVLLDALGHPVTPPAIADISPWRFRAPLSPDMAAAREGRSLDVDAVLTYCRAEIGRKAPLLLIEGVGGVMVPLDGRHTVLDWMAALDLPVLLVTGSYLGTLSHTLTALEVLRHRKLRVAALAVNETAGSTVPLAETMDTLARFTGGIPQAAIPRMPPDAADSHAFATLAELLGLSG